MTLAEQVTEPVAEHGEGPVWDVAAERLRFVDMLRGDLLTLRPDSGVDRRHVGSVAAAWRPRAAGGLVVAVERGFALIDAGGGTPQYLPELWSDHAVRMNDGGCDPQGSFYCGSMTTGSRPGEANLYRLNTDRTVDVVLSGVTVSNGLAWSPDGARVYYVDTPTSSVDVFDYQDATFRNRRQFAAIPVEQGMPDGISVDAEGGVWVALWGGAAVHRYAPDGRLDARVDLPVRQVSACTFGQSDLDTLYITTSRHGLGAGAEPVAGAVFAVSPGVRGLPSVAYAG